MQKQEFMEAIVLQFAKFFKQLGTYCEENVSALAGAKGAGDLSSKKSKKKKPKRDPNRPKKPLTPFFMFFMEMRDGVKQANPELSAKQITEELGRQWRALTDDKKQKYQSAFTEQYEAYKVKLAEYYAKKGIDPKGKPKAPVEVADDGDTETLGKRSKSGINSDGSSDEESDGVVGVDN